MGYHQINNVALFRTLHRYRGLKLQSYCRENSKPSLLLSSTDAVKISKRPCSSTARCNIGCLDLGKLASSHNNTYFSSSIKNSSISQNYNGSRYLKQKSSSFKPIFNHTLGFHTSTTSFEEVRTIVVPPFADSVSEGDVRWEKGVGDFVNEDDVVAQIETDKTAISIPAPVSGVIEALLVEDGTTVKSGQEIFKLKVTGDASAGSSKPATASVPTPPPPTPSAVPPPPSPTPSAAPSPPVTSTPQPSLHSKEAPQQPIPKSAPPPPPKPTTPLKRTPVPEIKMTPIQPMLGSKVPPADFSKKIVGSRAEQRVKMNRMRLRIAERLKDAQNTNAMLTTFNELDMSNIMELRKTYQDKFTKKYNIKLGFMSAFMKASAYALQHQPVVNAVIEGNEIVYRDYVDISVAVATPKGLVVPVVRGVESMDYADIELEIMRLGEKAKAGALAIEDMDGGTFTISNGGVFGSLFGTPIINPPQSAILGMHGVFERPVAVKGQVVIRPMMFIALTYDHRLIDGREAVTFLRTIKGAVEDPRVLLMGL